MIKLIVFDLDGVLVEARDIHYLALNEALAKSLASYISCPNIVSVATS